MSNQNIGYLPELLEWCKTEKIFVHLDPVHVPHYFNPSIIPNNLKKIITEKLNNYLLIYNYSDQIKDRLRQMINLMNVDDPNYIKLFKDFVDYGKQLDNLRSHDFEKVFPMWKGYYDY